jgi:hypothetical protein
VVFVQTHLLFLFSDYRLTFWLSNSVVLRTIISQANRDLELPLSAENCIERNGGGKVNNKVSTSLKWKASSPGRKEALYGGFGNWEDTHTFTSALEKIEGWIFSRIVESIWWQVTPQFFFFLLSSIFEFSWKCFIAKLVYSVSTFIVA